MPTPGGDSDDDDDDDDDAEDEPKVSDPIPRPASSLLRLALEGMTITASGAKS